MDEEDPLIVVGYVAPGAGEGTVAYLPNLRAQEALYWLSRERGWNLSDREVGDILRLVAPILKD